MTGHIRVFGDAAKFRRGLRYRIKVGRDLLDEIDGARSRLSEGSDTDRLESLIDYAMFDSIVRVPEERCRRWKQGTRSLLVRHLGDRAEDFRLADLKALELRSAKATNLDLIAKAIEHDVQMLEDLLAEMPARRDVGQLAPAGIRLDELRASGLLEPDVIDALENRMSRLGTRRRLPGAIGAAKELVEAVLKAALERLGEPEPPVKSTLLELGKLVRRGLAKRRSEVAPDDASYSTLDRLQAGLAGIEQALAELRNRFGEGHGRPRIPPGLRVHHARLAIDTAETYVRFLVSTLDDLRLL